MLSLKWNRKGILKIFSSELFGIFLKTYMKKFHETRVWHVCLYEGNEFAGTVLKWKYEKYRIYLCEHHAKKKGKLP